MTDNISLRTTVCMNARCFLHTCLTCSSNLSNNSKPHQINFRPDQSQVWSESIMEEPEGVLKHKLKVYAYRKTRRLLRIGNRKAGHDPRWCWWWWMIGVVKLFCCRSLFEGALIFQREEDDPEEVDEEELRKQRLEKNKEWRKRREMERWESCGMKPPPDPEVLREKNREKARKIEKKLFKEFLCSCCG